MVDISGATGSLLPVLLSSKALADKPPVAPTGLCDVQHSPLRVVTPCLRRHALLRAFAMVTSLHDRGHPWHGGPALADATDMGLDVLAVAKLDSSVGPTFQSVFSTTSGWFDRLESLSHTVLPRAVSPGGAAVNSRGREPTGVLGTPCESPGGAAEVERGSFLSPTLSKVICRPSGAMRNGTNLFRGLTP